MLSKTKLLSTNRAQGNGGLWGEGKMAGMRGGRGEGRGARGTLRPATREPGGGGGGSSLEGGGRFCSTIHFTSSASSVSYLQGGRYDLVFYK